MKILGFSARKEGGKDSAASFVIRNAGRLFGPAAKVQRFGIADPIKDILVHLCGLDRAKLYGSAADKEQAIPGHPRGMTYRRACQVVGGILAEVYANVWVDRAMLMVRVYDPDVAILTDVRFPKEVAAIHAHGGRVIRFLRGRADDGDVSENSLDGFDGFDAVVDNRNCSEDERNAHVLRYLQEWKWLSI